jgi:hypothetical protein
MKTKTHADSTVDTPVAESLPAKRGRPSSYDPEIAAQFCEKLAEGQLAINIQKLPGMPKFSTIYRWIAAYPEFKAAYATARELQAHSIAEQAVDTGMNATAENAQAARLQFDAGRWFASRMLAGVYGDRTETRVSGEIVHTTSESRQARIQQLLAKQITDAKLIDGTVEENPDATY